MKILMLTPYLPYPPASGGQIRTYNLLKHLTQSHEVHLVCLYKREEEKKQAHHLSSLCKSVHLCKRAEKPWQPLNILKAILGKWPFLVVRNYSPEAAQTVRRLLSEESFDVIHAETFYIMPHIPDTTIPILLVEQTIEYRVYKHFIESRPWFVKHPLRIDTYKLKYWETYYWRRATLVAAVSQADAEAIKVLEPSLTPVIIPNGAGDEMFEHQTLYDKSRLSSDVRLLFMGNFSWLQNSEAADILIEQIYPRLTSSPVPITLIIAGQNIPERYRSLPDSSIQIVDLAHDDTMRVRELYATSSIFVAPIYGPGGTRLKILGAMASKLPIITTETGAAGLMLEHDESYIDAEDVDGFVRSILELATDRAKQDDLASRAYAIAREHYSWGSITHNLVDAYERMTGGKGR